MFYFYSKIVHSTSIRTLNMIAMQLITEFKSTIFIELCHFCFEVQVGLNFKSNSNHFHSLTEETTCIVCTHTVYTVVCMSQKRLVWLYMSWQKLESRNSNTKWVMDMWAVSAVVPNKTHHRNRVQVSLFSFILSTSLSILYTESTLLGTFLSLRELHSSNFKVNFDNGALQSYYFLMDSHSLYLSLHPSTLLCEHPYLHFFVFSSLIVLYQLSLTICSYNVFFFWWLRCVRLRDSRFGVALINPRR